MEWILSVVLIIYLCKPNNKNKRIGKIGENRVKRELKRLDKRFIVKNNLIIRGSQIDHLVLFSDGNNKRAFVIETKLWGGNITGTASSHNWKQYLNGSVKEMYSPVKQNRKHCLAVKSEYGPIPIVSVVCMCGEGNYPEIEGVVHLQELISYLYSKI